MNYAQIRQHYLSGCLQANAAASEADFHLSEGQRTVSARLDLEDTETVDVGVATTANQDWVEKPTGIYRIIHAFERTSGQELQPEPAGIRGRAQYLEPATGRPAVGPPRWYVVSGGKVYLRPTPADDSYTIQLRGKATTPNITESDYGSEPGIPEQYHMGIAWAAMLSFLTTHPEVAKQVGPETMRSIEIQLEQRLLVQELPKERERFDKRGRIFLRGFRPRMS